MGVVRSVAFDAISAAWRRPEAEEPGSRRGVGAAQVNQRVRTRRRVAVSRGNDSVVRSTAGPAVGAALALTGRQQDEHAAQASEASWVRIPPGCIVAMVSACWGTLTADEPAG